MGDIIKIKHEPSKEILEWEKEMERQVDEECALMTAYERGEKQTPFEKRRSKKLLDEYYDMLSRNAKDDNI